MSQENVEVVVDFLKRVTAGRLDALAEFLAPGIKWRAAEGEHWAGDVAGERPACTALL
jgi:hypothetical protein